MDLSRLVCEAFEQVVQDGISRISQCATEGISCEGWLKVELLHRLSSSEGAGGELTRVYPERGNVDLTIHGLGQEALLELKTFPTNYGRSGKPITNFIDGVIRDLDKLKTKRRDDQIGLSLWLAYYVPYPETNAWLSHLTRVQASAGRTVKSMKFPLSGGLYAMAYLMESL